MKVHELVNLINSKLTLDKAPPELLEVDADTYANAVEHIVKTAMKLRHSDKVWEVGVFIGPHGKVLFKNVELIYKP